MNKEWHKQHTMPTRATEKERIEWHLEHTKNCACRPFPPGLMAKLSEADHSNLAKAQVGKIKPEDTAVN
jgi:hypothetical protein